MDRARRITDRAADQRGGEMLKTDDEQRPSTTRAGVAVEQITVLVRDNGFVPAGSALVLHGNTKDDATGDQRSLQRWETVAGRSMNSRESRDCNRPEPPGIKGVASARQPCAWLRSMREYAVGATNIARPLEGFRSKAS